MGGDRTLRLWDPLSGETVATLNGHRGRWDEVRSLCAVSAGDRVLLASGGDGSLRMWDPATGEAVATSNDGGILSLCALEAGGRVLLASGDRGGVVLLWNPVTAEVVARFSWFSGHRDRVNSVCALEAQGRVLLASAGVDSAVRLWDPVSGEAVASLEGHTGPVNSICALEVGGRVLLASGGDDWTVRLWDPITLQAHLVVPVRHEVRSVVAVDGGLGVASSAGVLVLEIPAGRSAETTRQLLQPELPRPLNFFISYTQPDQAWADWIAWELEAAGHAVALQSWDFRPGSDFVAEMDQALVRAEHVLVVLSPAYVESNFAMAEWRAAFADDPEGRRRHLIPVRVADFRPRGLHATRIYVDLVGSDERKARAALLAGVHQGRAKPLAAPPFPGRALREAPRFPGAS